MNNMKTRNLTHSAIIASLYVVLTFVSNTFGLASGVIQVRISEALTILPCFTSSAVPGLFVGCLLSNILTGCAPWDIVFGSIATLLGAIFTYKLRRYKYIALLPPIISNTVIIPFVLSCVYGVENAIWYLALTVGAGEIISCGILGGILYKVLSKRTGLI